jgi:hypothetical protein
LAAVRSSTGVGKHADLYVINGSEASQASSAGGVSRFSRRSSNNYEPLPHNGIGRVRHTRLTEEEVDHQSAANNGGQKRSPDWTGSRERPPDWTGSRERKAAIKIAKVRYLYQVRLIGEFLLLLLNRCQKLQSYDR